MDHSLASNHLTHSTVNTKTREELRRAESGNSKAPNQSNGNGSTSAFASLDDMDGERRPLLGHHATSTLHAEPGFWRHLLIHNQSSPGTNDPNPFVRWPARVWNVTKITLLSCTYFLFALDSRRDRC
jgi:Ca2+:H+ antiporter